MKTLNYIKLFFAAMLLLSVSFSAKAQVPCVQGITSSDNFQDATLIQYDLGYCTSTSSAYTIDLPTSFSSNSSLFQGSIENNSWFKFVAQSSQVAFNINISNCSNSDGTAQFGFYRYNNGGFTLLSDISYTSGLSNNQSNYNNIISGINAGETLYIMIDGYNGNTCDIQVQLIDSVLDPNNCMLSLGSDQMICNGTSVSLTAYGTYYGTTFTWGSIPYDPSLNGNGAQIIANPTVTTTYFVESNTNGAICRDTVVVSVVPLPIVNAGSDVSTCEGQSITLTASGGSDYAWSNNAGMMSDVVVTPVGTTTYTVTVTTVEGCTASDDVVVSVLSSPIPNIGVTVDSSLVDTLTYNFAATYNCPACTYQWIINGVIIDTIPTLTYSVPYNTNFFVGLNVTNANGCVSSNSITINSADTNHLITGRVYFGQQLIDKGIVYLYGKIFGIVSLVATQNITNGYYSFNKGNFNNYYVKAELTSSSVEYNNYAPTYYGDVLDWNDAISIQSNNPVVSADIHLLPMTFSPGSGSIGGILTSVTGTKSNDINNVDIYLYNNSNSTLVAHTKTNATGQFSFNNIAFADYNVFAEYIGKQSTPVNIIINANNPTNSSVSLLVSEANVGGIANNNIEKTNMNVYPNPATDFITIENMALGSELSIVNISGQEILYQNISSEKVQINISNLNRGIYIVKISSVSRVEVKRFVKE
ncbi:MAG: T9SS type A sorting domain-containing protein [Bacteroidota bacterium]